MAWRTVVIANPATLTIENSQLVIRQVEAVTIPMADISVLILESPEILLSTSVLYRLAAEDVHVVVCDDKHMPCMSALPCEPHSRVSGVQRTQLSMTEPFNKRCWQRIVVQKINNQAACLDQAEVSGGSSLREIAKTTLSGDSDNREGVAARQYFGCLFGSEFIRGRDDRTNAALNYGYAVVRASVARSLSGHGFSLTHGIHHHSELNAFNLADDFIEPFRPVVDLYVFQTVPNDGQLTQADRRGIVSVLAMQMMVAGQRHSVSNAAEMLAGSYSSACKRKDPAALCLPNLLPLSPHNYE